MNKWLMLAILGLLMALVAPVLAETLDAGSAPALDAGPKTISATPAAAPGGAAPTPQTSIGDVVAAARAGKWLVAIGGALILLTALLRWVAARAGLKWFATDRGGAVLVGLTSLFSALGTTLIAPGAHLDFTTFAAALAVTWSAAGGYSWLKKIFSLPA